MEDPDPLTYDSWKKESYMTAQKRTAIIVLAVAVLMLAVGAALHIAINTDFGSVKVDRLTVLDGEGKEVSLLVYKPDTATAETPAPAVITNHGGGNSIEAQGSYNVELARRGYVVVSWDASNSGLSEKSTDLTHGGEAAYSFTVSLPFVDSSNMAASGHSMGGIYTFMIAQNHPGNIKIVIPVGMNPGMNDTVSPFLTNYACIIGSTDESNLVRSDGDILNMAHNEQYHDFFALADDEVLEVNKVYGSFEDGTGRAFFMPDSSHSASMINGGLIALYLDLIQSVVPAPEPIDSTDQIWGWRDIGSILEFFGLILFFFGIALALLSTEYFSTLHLPSLKTIGFKAGSVAWVISLVLLMLIPVVLFIPTSTMAMRHTLPSFMGLDTTANGFVLWSLITGIVLLVFFLVFHFAFGKKRGGDARSYGLATGKDDGFHIGYVLKALSFALAVTGATYIVYIFLFYLTQEDMRVWLAVIRPIPMFRIRYVPVYLLIQLPFFLTGGLAARSINMNNGERANGMAMFRSVLLSALIGMVGLIVMFIVYWVTFKTTGIVLFPNDRGYIFAGAIYSMFPSFLVGNCINCYITNKTNSVYAGVFCAVLWATWIMVGGNAIA